VSRPLVATTRSELAAALAPVRAAGRTVALVPTMGALHAGHRSLVERAAGLADAVVVSIFVNPAQFGPGEDFDRYPRSLDADVALCGEAGTAVVFAPDVAEMYPAGDSQVRVCAGPLGAVLEGAVRPGHFDGVLTVVAKLFGLVGPQVAVLGHKDAQQLALVRRMVVDLDLPVRIEAAPTVREDNGLALSSRNRFLDGPGLAAAAALSRALRAGDDAGRRASGAGAPRAAEAAVAVARSVLDSAPGVDPEYVAAVEPGSFADPIPADAAAVLLVVAARVGGTRLIDNTLVRLPGAGGDPGGTGHGGGA
jgi:pantoate--beta-alanine ligase